MGWLRQQSKSTSSNTWWTSRSCWASLTVGQSSILVTSAWASFCPWMRSSKVLWTSSLNCTQSPTASTIFSAWRRQTKYRADVLMIRYSGQVCGQDFFSEKIWCLDCVWHFSKTSWCFTYLQEWSKKTLKVSRELAQCTSLPLGIAVSTDFNQCSHSGFEPAKIPFLELCIIPQLLHTTTDCDTARVVKRVCLIFSAVTSSTSQKMQEWDCQLMAGTNSPW